MHISGRFGRRGVPILDHGGGNRKFKLCNERMTGWRGALPRMDRRASAHMAAGDVGDLPFERAPPKISKTTPCKVADRLPHADRLDASGKSGALLHHSEMLHASPRF